jgi:phospholipase/carboxylesterase
VAPITNAFASFSHRERESLATIEVEPRGEPIGSVVVLHGMGASGHDFEDALPLLHLPRVRFVLPHAPLKSVTVEGGRIMPAWHDIRVLDDGEPLPDASDVHDSALMIEAVIASEIERGIPASRIALAGFSQGAAMSLFVGLRYPSALAGIACVSGYTLFPNVPHAKASPASRSTPVLFCHGTRDTVVPPRYGRAAHRACAQGGRSTEWHEFEVGHEVCLRELRAIGDWLRRRFDTARHPAAIA